MDKSNCRLLMIVIAQSSVNEAIILDLLKVLEIARSTVSSKLFTILDEHKSKRKLRHCNKGCNKESVLIAHSCNPGSDTERDQ